MVVACRSKCSSRKKFSTWLANIISMKFFLKRHSALQWGLPMDLTFYFSKDLKHLISNFKPRIEIQTVAAVVLDLPADVRSVHFAFRQLELTHQREDYRELLE